MTLSRLLVFVAVLMCCFSALSCDGKVGTALSTVSGWIVVPDPPLPPLVTIDVLVDGSPGSLVSQDVVMKAAQAGLPGSLPVISDHPIWLSDALGTPAIALPDEPFVELGMNIKAASPFRQTNVIELANGPMYYIPNRSAFPEGQYEVVTTRYAEGAGEMLVTTAIRLLAELHRDAVGTTK